GLGVGWDGRRRWGGARAEAVPAALAEAVVLGVESAAPRAHLRWQRREGVGRRDRAPRGRSPIEMRLEFHGSLERPVVNLAAAQVAVIGRLGGVPKRADHSHGRPTRTVLVERVSSVISSASSTLDFSVTLPVVASSTSTTLDRRVASSPLPDWAASWTAQ